MFSFKKKSHGDHLSSLIVTTEGSASATIRQTKSGKPILEHCGFYPLAPGQEIQTNLKNLIQIEDWTRPPVPLCWISVTTSF